MTRGTVPPWGECMEDDPMVGLALVDEGGGVKRANRAFRSWWELELATEGDALGPVGLGCEALVGLASAGDRLLRSGVALPSGKVGRISARRVGGGFLLTVVDTTEEHRGRVDASPSEESYRDLLDAALDGMVLMVGGQIQLCNHAFASMLGYTVAELEGSDVAQLTTPSSHGTIMTAIRSQDETPYEVVGLRKDGSTFPARIRGRNIRLRGRPARLTAVADLSPEREVQRALEERERRYRELAELLPVAVLEVDLAGRITFANARAVRVFERRALVGSRLEALIPDDPQRVLAALRDSADGELVTFRRGESDVFDGRVFGAEMSHRGRVLGTRVVVVASDERLGPPIRSFLDARRMESLAALAGGLAHDFNNLLAAVRGNADLARRRLPVDHPARGAVDAIGLATTKGAMVTAKLLASSGAEPLDLQPLQLSQVIEDTVDVLWEAVDERARLRLRIEPDVAWIQGAPGPLSTVIVNLVLNAAEAVDPPAWIDLELRTVPPMEAGARGLSGEGAWVCLEVRDDGCGMAPEVEARAFEPFFSTKFAGRGLGLSAVQGIVHSHGGVVALDSEPGRGTTVHVCIPAAEAPRSAPGVAVAAGGASSGRRSVIVADDETPLRLMLRTMLEDLGFEVAEAEDGVRCLELLRARPDTAAVLLDAAMPRMGGAEVMRVMREEAIDVPVILCSGFPADIAAHDDHGPDRFLAKPFGLDELERVLRSLVGA